MVDFEFYKSFYDRELQRRFDLDNALNIPIGLIAILLATASYIISNLSKDDSIVIYWIILSITGVSVILILIAIFSLARSYNDLFKGFKYLNFATSTEWRDYQKQLESFNNNPETKEKLDFENEVIKKLNSYTDSHIKINEFRQVQLRNAKSWIIISLLLLLVALTIVIIKKFIL